MKTILKLFLLAAITLTTVSLSMSKANAQILKPFTAVKDSVVNTDNTTISITTVTSDVVAFHLKGTRASGTVAGTASLQGSIDGTNWLTIDTAYTLVNAAHIMAVFEPTKLSFSHYRIYISSTGTHKVTGITAYTLRRTAR